MQTWLDTMLAELSDVKNEDNVAPDSPVAASERVVGTVPPKVRKIFYQYSAYQQRAMLIVAETKLMPAAVRKPKEQEAQVLLHQAQVMQDIFWTCCRVAYPELWHKNNIGLREGWQLVWFPSSPLSSRISVLGLMGGSGLAELLGGLGDAPDDDQPQPPVPPQKPN